MTERSAFWDGTTGDGGPYSSTAMMDFVFRMLFAATGNEGVLDGWLNELAVTDGGGLNASVDTGGALVYGLFYENDAPATVALPDNSTVHVVVRRNYAAQTARLTQVAALTQNTGVTWDIPLAEVTTVGGAITLITDERDFVEMPMRPPDESVVAASFATGAVTTAKLENQTRNRVHGAGALKSDATYGAYWTAYDFMGWEPMAVGIVPAWRPFAPGWRLGYYYGSGVTNFGVWLTELIPEDLVGGTISVYTWNTVDVTYPGATPALATGNVYWQWQAWVGASGGAFAAQTGGTAVAQTGRVAATTWDTPWVPGMYRDLIATVNVTAGNLMHMYVWRDTAHGSDTGNKAVKLMAIELSYTADS